MRRPAPFCLSLVAFLLAALVALPTGAQQRTLPDSERQVMLSFAPIVRKAAPAVVNIYTKRVVEQSLDQPRLGCIRGDHPHSIVLRSSGREEILVGEVQDDVPDQEGVQEVVP